MVLRDWYPQLALVEAIDVVASLLFWEAMMMLMKRQI